jgi:hypothetical protein
MAVLSIMPEQAIIDGYKGVVDFYEWMGIPVARRWPRSPGHDRAVSVQQRWPSFTIAAREWANLSPAMQAAYNKMARSSGLCGRDIQIRGYLSGIYRYSTGV